MMGTGKLNAWPALADRLVRDWPRVVALVWLIAAMVMLWVRWNGIHWFALPDTDDNIRIVQVRDWLHGQGWYDLRQYRLNPPAGFDIHWSRLVDLPIAAILVVLRPIFGGAIAEQAAVAIAPLLPLGAAMTAAAVTARRLIAPGAYPVAIALLLCCPSAIWMFMPLRIDHHGWQLALLAWSIAGLADPRQARGGLTVAVATVLSLVIGLETLPFLAIAGGAMALRWVWDAGEVDRLRSYALALGGGSALGYALFASNANRGYVCDALSPVWLSAILLGCALLYALSFLRLGGRVARLAAAALAGAVVGIAFALVWPDCLSRPERVSPELDRLWLSNVREAKPIYEHKVGVIVATVTLPLIGLLGTVLATWRARRDPARLPAWLAILALALASGAMLLWQARIGAAAQVIAVVGASALGWVALGWLTRLRIAFAMKAAGAAMLALLISGVVAQDALRLVVPEKPNSALKAVGRANARCPTLPALAPIARLPATTVMTFVDLGPRLIAVTHHRAIAGPYHRNGDAILDIHHAFGGTPEAARRIARKHGATLLLTCPNMAESTNYRARNPGGFYGQLAAGKRFDWLEPMPLPRASPLRLWRIR